MRIHSSWQDTFQKAYASLTPEFQAYLETEVYLPQKERVFAVFSRPKSTVRQVLLGESPYPREHSANGYAFWDANVHALWSTEGLSKRSIVPHHFVILLKCCCIAKGDLQKPFLAKDIAILPKQHMIQTLDELFWKNDQKGILLLNASLTWSKDRPVTWHAKQWHSFIVSHFKGFDWSKSGCRDSIIWKKLLKNLNTYLKKNCMIAEQPYVLTFIENQSVLEYFKPLNLLSASNE